LLSAVDSTSEVQIIEQAIGDIHYLISTCTFALVMMFWENTIWLMRTIFDLVLLGSFSGVQTNLYWHGHL